MNKAGSNISKRIREYLLFTLGNSEEPLTEEKLARYFKVSRTPIRKALHQLEGAGILERKQKKGSYIKKPTLKEISEFYDLRSVLESFAAGQASQNITGKELTELKKIYQTHLKSIKKNDRQSANRTDLMFHSKIIELAGNSLLKKMSENFQVIDRTLRLENTLITSLDEDALCPYNHQRIIEALQTRDMEKCEEILRYHIQWTKQKMIELAIGAKIDSFKR